MHAAWLTENSCTSRSCSVSYISLKCYPTVYKKIVWCIEIVPFSMCAHISRLLLSLAARLRWSYTKRIPKEGKLSFVNLVEILTTRDTYPSDCSTREGFSSFILHLPELEQIIVYVRRAKHRACTYYLSWILWNTNYVNMLHHPSEQGFQVFHEDPSHEKSENFACFDCRSPLRRHIIMTLLLKRWDLSSIRMQPSSMPLENSNLSDMTNLDSSSMREMQNATHTPTWKRWERNVCDINMEWGHDANEAHVTFACGDYRPHVKCLMLWKIKVFSISYWGCERVIHVLHMLTSDKRVQRCLAGLPSCGVVPSAECRESWRSALLLDAPRGTTTALPLPDWFNVVCSTECNSLRQTNSALWV